MKRFICLFLFFIMVLQVCPLSVLAESEQVYFDAIDHPQNYKTVKEIPTRSPSFDVTKLEELLYDGFSSCQTSVDISSLRIKPTDENINVISNLIYYEMPECFHVYGFGWRYTSSTILQIVPKYQISASEYHNMRAKLVTVKNELIKGIKGNDQLDDIEKALLLHDRLAMVCQYDYSYSEMGSTTYGAMVNGAAVCQGYAEAYDYLLDEVGVRSEYCISNQLNHIWNIVYIDDLPYHVDVTWDDIAWGNGERGAAGAVEHSNFLRSSNGIYATGHNANDYITTPNDTTYDNYFWQKSETSFQLIGNELYYIDNQAGELRRYSDHKELRNLSSNWSYYGNQARLSGDGKYLYYSLADAVYQYDVSQGISTKIYTPNLSGYNKIYGFAYLNGYLICDIADMPPYYYGRSFLQQIKQRYDAPTIGTVERWNVLLDSEITANFFLKVDSGIINTAKVKITVGEESVTENIAALSKVNDLYKISVKISAVQLNDVITVEILNATDSSEKFTYSVRQYCDSILEDSSQKKYHAIIKELLNYGAMAQLYFDHNASDLANEGLSGLASIAVPKKTQDLIVDDNVAVLNFYGASLVYRDRIAVRFYFTGNTSGCTFSINGKNYLPVAKDGMYYIEVADILPQNLDQQITLNVANTQGKTLSVSYGPMNYIVRMNQTGDSKTQNLMEALYNYHLAVKSFAA